MRLLFFLILSALCILGKKISVEENDAIQKECKPIHAKRIKRVLYGERVAKDEMKYVVNIQIGMEDGSSRCSGTIISPKHVLTAGHCFYEKTLCNKTKDMNKLFPNRRTFVHFGGNCVMLDPAGNCAEGEANRRIEATKVMIPRRYGVTGCRVGDLAIVEVAETFPAELGFACIPNVTRKFTGRVYAAGYGSDPRDMQAAVKYKEKAEFTAEKYCDYSLHAPKDTICTEEEKQFLCRGDSGSGIIQTIENKPTIFGVHSTGTFCSLVKGFIDRPKAGRRFKGSINTDVRKYLKWICGNTGVCLPGLDRKEKVKKKTISIE